MRCFVAIELDHPLRERLCRAVPRATAGRDVRWCRPEQLHLTLKFLGEVSTDALSAIGEVVRFASRPIEPFNLTLEGVGAFPSPRSPRVLWVGLRDPARACERWIDAADPPFESLGFSRETRRFQPHVTLARSQTAAGARALSDCVRAAELPVDERVRVGEVVLFESRLLPGGAEYTALLRAPLGGAG